MSKILKPRRGTITTMRGVKRNTVLAAGELFLEAPATGIGTGEGAIKCGDGVTTYENLPYFMKATDMNTSAVNVTENSASAVANALNDVSSGNTLPVMLGALKKGISLLSNTISTINTELSTKATVSNLNTTNNNLTSLTNRVTALENSSATDAGMTALSNRVTALENRPVITVDSALSSTSTNPVQNKIVNSNIQSIRNLIPTSASASNKLATMQDAEDKSKQYVTKLALYIASPNELTSQDKVNLRNFYNTYATDYNKEGNESKMYFHVKTDDRHGTVYSNVYYASFSSNDFSVLLWGVHAYDLKTVSGGGLSETIVYEQLNFGWTNLNTSNPSFENHGCYVTAINEGGTVRRYTMVDPDTASSDTAHWKKLYLPEVYVFVSYLPD